ncbi:hypothetical protein AB0L41_31895 [Amycolatopsis mediterranei]|uniref:hypothetical protein n=1 Tax=Amycolatopsis mediterranei TaxID=33910 RepID=UPI003429C11C
MFPFDELGHAAHALIREAEQAGTALVQSVDDALGWAGDLFSGDVGVQAMPVADVVNYVIDGDSTSWADNGSKSGTIGADHHELAGDLAAVLNNLEPAWTGEGADRARERIKAFSDLVSAAATTLSSNGGNVTDAAYGFELARRSMEPMGAPPDKTFFDVAVPWNTDTEEAIAAYNAKAEKNLAIYNDYATHLSSQGQGLSGDYGQLTPDRVAGSTDSFRVTGERGVVKPDRAQADTTSPDTPAEERDYATPGTDEVRPGETARRGTTDDVREKEPSKNVTRQDGLTTAAGLTPSLRQAGSPVLSGSDLAQLGRAGAPVRDPAELPLVEISPGAAQGLRGGEANELGTKARRGAGSPGAAVRGSTGNEVVGKRGAAGATGAATPAGRVAAEDREHKRKYIHDDSSVFADTVDELVDPRTGLPPTPPTIGT